MDADNPISLGINNDFHEGFFVAATEGVFHGAKAGFEQTDIPKSGASLLLGEAYRADGRLTEHGSRYEIIIHLLVQATEITSCERHTLGESHWREFDASGHVSEGKYTWLTGAKLFVDLYGTLLTKAYIYILQTEICEISLASGGIEHGIGLEFGVIG